MGNENHDPDTGRFSSGSASGAAVGDHGATSPSVVTRNVPGHGTVRRSKVVAMHAHTPSVGTSSGGGGGSGGDGMLRLSAAARERVKLNRQLDESHYPTETDASVAAKTALLGPRPVAPGKLDPRLSTLISAKGPKPRVRLRAG